MKLKELMHDIREMNLVLPEFQREYVWTLDQAKQLVDSLLKDYPTGSLLVWKTSDPPEIKNNAVEREHIGTTSVILDGQQRLTTLYLLIEDEIPPYYTEKDIAHDPRELHYDLSNGDLQFYQATRMRQDPAWVRVTDCYREPCPVQPIEIAMAKAQDQAETIILANRYAKSLSALQAILVEDYPIQTVPPTATIIEAIDVFDRVNRQGTKLSQAELALAHIAGKWPEARRAMKEKIDDLQERGFVFDLTFMVRALTVVVRGRALFDTVHDAAEGELRSGWGRLEQILDYLVGVLPAWAHIHSTDDLGTTNVLIPVIAFLARGSGKFTNETDIRQCARWLYAASTWARYNSQTDQRLEHDVSLVAQLTSPWDKLTGAIVDQRGRIDMKPADLEGRGAQHPFYRMAFVLAKANGAIDWYTGQSLAISHVTPWHSHHIFPQARLYREGRLDDESYVDRQKVNEIANRAFLTSESNTKLGDTPPEVALAEVNERFPGALQKQFIPLNSELWKLENYDHFLAARRQLIADAYNDLMERMAIAPVRPEPRPVEELIAAGESGALEFKSSLRWDMRTQQVNKALQKVIAKTVAGFMNTEGGTLLIGVADDGTVVGIEHDMRTLGKQNVDGFELALTQTLGDYLGNEFSPYYRTSFASVEDHTVCRVDIDRSPKAIYLHDGPETEFYVRNGNATQPLDMLAAHEYIDMHWAA